LYSIATLTSPESDPTTEITRPLRVLEIGCGWSPRGYAQNSGGELFKDGLVSHVAMDLPEALRDPIWARDTIMARENVIEANCADIPFEDNSIDLVIMRSVWGQFTRSSERLLEDLRWRGIGEILRVLRPGGEYVIIEENQPYSPRRIERDLRHYGFAPTKFGVMEAELLKDEDPGGAWLALRQLYFNDKPIQHYKYGIGDDSPPYVLVAAKPKGTGELIEDAPYISDPRYSAMYE
jgi:SAM-dependent methyltransferase